MMSDVDTSGAVNEHNRPRIDYCRQLVGAEQHEYSGQYARCRARQRSGRHHLFGAPVASGTRGAIKRATCRDRRLQQHGHNRRHHVDPCPIGPDAARQLQQCGSTIPAAKYGFFARQYRADDGARIRRGPARSDHRGAEYPGWRQLHVFRQRSEPAFSGEREFAFSTAMARRPASRRSLPSACRPIRARAGSVVW